MKHKVRILLAFFAAIILGSVAYAQNSAAGVGVIVIDAGHGGAFPGAIYGKVKEKDLNLKVALKLGALIEKELPDVKVVYTRKTDIALGKTLNDDLTARANIANKAGGDFFISIHANAAPKATSVHGAETIIMGESEKETRYNESVLYNNNKDELIDMSDENTAAMVRAYIQNLQFTYGEYSEMMARIMQSHYAKGGRNARRVNRQLLKVLYATDMPSVLTEIGFMSNARELAYMNSEKGQQELARMLCNAVKEYVAHINRMTGVVSTVPQNEVQTPKVEEQKETPTKTQEEAPKVEKPVTKGATKVAPQPAQPKKEVEQKPEVADAADEEGYTIQVLASNKQISLNDTQFKSYRGKVKCYIGAGALKYKYCYGSYSTRAEAQRNLATLRRTFSGAFVVHYDDGKIVK
ncbi:MAG: N-acetylmuramoyl-L-alanine amidase [Rikenellaceae bacterium]|nr:N-acetylmuramoyl-L-alanine amidase [Rikenellaceae bacterium]